MSSSYYLSAYWGSRKESSTACARRLSEWLAKLAAADVSLAEWFLTGKKRSEALARPVDPADLPSLEALLIAGVNRRDSDRSPMPELGYSVHLWNGQQNAVAIGVTCGAHPSSPNLMNSVVVELPRPTGAAAKLYRSETLESLMEAVVDSWDPDWAVLDSDDLELPTAPRAPRVGWLTYLSRERGKPEALPPPVEVRPMGKGMLIMLVPDVLSANPRQAAALARRVTDVLESAGHLAPTP